MSTSRLLLPTTNQQQNSSPVIKEVDLNQNTPIPVVWQKTKKPPFVSFPRHEPSETIVISSKPRLFSFAKKIKPEAEQRKRKRTTEI
ncbi:hypothetical protein POMI540_4693 [Schizosaccharomyces pombe]|uniref:Uncharacterized protein C794.15 n=1 Tax=Schizosaccharomyces pombe (strain 972 / ATCC 24843) TaxID=284812 RepID=YCTF_SCHPO|nr:uncharacterized protein SPCC794.15 [Schizosaccharomyces pombe]Q9USI0.1 RecName: Full=Uncharacterized protein C794.15 [Schizosaccharomyces pombe 972h-]CAB62381.1 dubious [Schizosaccharomyces pombe]|eukprot:NP_001342931.1 uncharacterized protein SPCC794.15 [Schizosaccharomyces pombe]